MKFSTSSALAWPLVAALTLCVAAQAQTVLTGKDLNEKNLIEALSPAAPEGELRTRSIRVKPDPSTEKTVEQVAKAAAPKTASASVLITFVTNSSELTSRARSSLDVVGRALQADRLASFNFVIEGHADPRGNHEDNLRLSQARAERVVVYLVEQHGIRPDRLKPVGKGDTEVLNAVKIDAPENRRVTIVSLRE